jgi:20S proteasome alpha/beta subunit
VAEEPKAQMSAKAKYKLRERAALEKRPMNLSHRIGTTYHIHGGRLVQEEALGASSAQHDIAAGNGSRGQNGDGSGNDDNEANHHGRSP